MALSPTVVAELADIVQHAQDNAADIVKLTDTHPGLTVDDGYLVQAELLRRWTAAGRKLAGYKGGLTSKAKMVQMGVDVPGWGLVMADTCVPDGGVVEMAGLIHPKVEPEIAFVMGAELSGEVTVEQVLAATEFVMPALEIIDSRYRDFKFDLPSVIADNTSSAKYVVGGTPRRPDGLDLRLLGIVMEKNGALVATAAGASVMGHPAATIVELVRFLAGHDQTLAAGSVVLTGGATEAVAVQAGDHVTNRVQHLGQVSIRFT